MPTNRMRICQFLSLINLKVEKTHVTTLSDAPVSAPVDVPVHQQQQPPVPAYQPFDYRKFFDFSFFANAGSMFGGNPNAFGGPQPSQQQVQPAAQNNLISYTVQKQFAPVQYTPVEQDTQVTVEHQPPPPAQVAPETSAVTSTHTGFHKTVFVSPFAPLVAKHHFLRRIHPKRVHVVKTVQIQWRTTISF